MALGKLATSASLSCTLGSGPGNAVDGMYTNIHTDKWCARATVGLPSTLTVSFGTGISAGYTIRAFVVRHAGSAGEPQMLNTRDYSIRVSADGLSWSTAAVVTGNTANSNTLVVSPRSNIRFVQLVVTRATQITDQNARIYELEAHGDPTPSAGCSLLCF